MTDLVVPRRQFRGLQGLRFIAAASVVVHHSLFYAHERLDSSIHVWGIGAVELFFAISGFVAVVATRKFQERRDGWRYFLVRRGVRILPMYWAATTVKLLVLVAVPAAVLHAELDWGNVARSYLLLPSVNIDGDIAPLLGVGWTLLFESFFILVFAVSLVIGWRPVLTTGIILSACTLASVLRPEDFGPFLVYFSPFLIYYILGLVIGTVARTRRWLPFALGIGWVYSLHFLVQPQRLDSLIRISVIIALMLFMAFGESWLERWLPRSIVGLGDASYSLYLFHPLLAPIVPAAMAIVGFRVGWLAVIGSVGGAILASVLIYRWIEAPLTRVLQRRVPFATVPSRKVQPDIEASVGGGSPIQ